MATQPLRWRQQLVTVLMPSVLMLPNYENALAVVYQVLAEINLQRSKKDQVELSPSVVLSGADSRLDSLALSNLIIFTEQKVQEAFGVEIDLTEDDPFSLENDHMRTTRALALHIVKLVEKS